APTAIPVRCAGERWPPPVVQGKSAAAPADPGPVRRGHVRRGLARKESRGYLTWQFPLPFPMGPGLPGYRRRGGRRLPLSDLLFSIGGGAIYSMGRAVAVWGRIQLFHRPVEGTLFAALAVGFVEAVLSACIEAFLSPAPQAGVVDRDKLITAIVGGHL